jgi:hypothetical protein
MLRKLFPIAANNRKFVVSFFRSEQTNRSRRFPLVPFSICRRYRPPGDNATLHFCSIVIASVCCRFGNIEIVIASVSYRFNHRRSVIAQITIMYNTAMFEVILPTSA